MPDLYRVENIEGLGYVEPPSPDDGPPWPFADEMLHRMIDARVLVKVEPDYDAAAERLTYKDTREMQPDELARLVIDIALGAN